MLDDANPEVFQYSLELSGSRWTAPQFLPAQGGILAVPPESPDFVRQSWPEEISLVTEAGNEPGLRRPQAGAVHALLGYWTTSPKAPATVVIAILPISISSGLRVFLGD